jgi:hypothetical protein
MLGVDFQNQTAQRLLAIWVENELLGFVDML